MAIFGTIDAKALANNVSVTNNTKTVTTAGDFTDRTSANFIQAGDILSLSSVQYTVESVVSATTLSLTTAYAGSTGTVTAANAIRRTAPKEVANLLINENQFPSGTQFIFVDKLKQNSTKIKFVVSSGQVGGHIEHTQMAMAILDTNQNVLLLLDKLLLMLAILIMTILLLM